MLDVADMADDALLPIGDAWRGFSEPNRVLIHEWIRLGILETTYNADEGRYYTSCAALRATMAAQGAWMIELTPAQQEEDRQRAETARAEIQAREEARRLAERERTARQIADSAAYTAALYERDDDQDDPEEERTAPWAGEDRSDVPAPLTARETAVIHARMAGRSYRLIAEDFGVPTERIRQIYRKAERKLASCSFHWKDGPEHLSMPAWMNEKNPTRLVRKQGPVRVPDPHVGTAAICPRLMNDHTPIEQLALPPRVYHALKRANIETVSDSAALTEEEVLRVRNVGKIALTRLCDALRARPPAPETD